MLFKASSNSWFASFMRVAPLTVSSCMASKASLRMSCREGPAEVSARGASNGDDGASAVMNSPVPAQRKQARCFGGFGAGSERREVNRRNVSTDQSDPPVPRAWLGRQLPGCYRAPLLTPVSHLPLHERSTLPTDKKTRKKDD